MISHTSGSRNRRRAVSLLLAAAIAGSVWSAPAAYAGKEGIYLNAEAYFTLEKIGFTSVSDGTNLQFSIRLHNGSRSAVNFGAYGALVQDSSGRRYSAKLTAKRNALVQPGQEQDYGYVAKLPSGAAPDDLQVIVFAWDYSRKTYMRELGAFSVAAAVEADGANGAGSAVYLNAADEKLPADAAASFAVARLYEVYEEDGGWHLYADLLVTNHGSSALTLPSSIVYQLEDAEGNMLPLEASGPALGAIPAGKTRKLTLKSGVALDGGGNGRPWTVHVEANRADGTELTLASVGANSGGAIAGLGGSEPYIRADGSTTLSFKLDSASAVTLPDKTVVKAVVTLSQSAAKYASLPALQARFQSKSGAGSFEAADTGSHPAYLSANGSEPYVFEASLPADADPDDLQLVLFETAGSGAAAAAHPVFVGDLDGVPTKDSLDSEAVAYTLGEKLPLETGGMLDEDMSVSLMDLQLYQNESTGYATAVAKFKLTNNDSSALPVPDLLFDLAGPDGRVYSGVRQQNAVSSIAPNTSYMVAYSFQVPGLEPGADVELRAYEQKAGSVSRISLGSFATALQIDETDDNKWNVYPFELVTKEYYRTMNMGSGTFNYMLQLHLDLKRLESIVYDTTLSAIQFEYTDVFGIPLSTATASLTGASRMVSGRNTITIPNIKTSQYGSGDKINVYEVIQTPNGQVKRLLGTFQP